MLRAGEEAEKLVAGQAIQLGAEDYISKPFDRKEVQAKVSGILDHQEK